MLPYWGTLTVTSSNRTAVQGYYVCSMMSELNFSQLIEEATRVTQTSSSLIDLLYTNNLDIRISAAMMLQYGY